MFACSCFLHMPGNSARNMPSPGCTGAPRSMLSSTVRRLITLVSWKVRTMPMRATFSGCTWAMSLPSNCQVPVFGVSKPVIRLKNVVLPAPFGPISAVMPCRSISKWLTSTAVMPPNLRVTLSATRIGSGLCTPGLFSTNFRSSVTLSR